MRKKKETRWRHYFIVRIARIILFIPIRIMYNFKFKILKQFKKKGPFLILGNHTIPLDPLLMGAFFPFHIHYFASEQIFNLGLLSKMLVYAVNPIKKTKSMNDIGAIRQARKIVQEGGSVGVYPEGNVTYNGATNHFDKSIVKLVRFLKIPVVLFVTEGMYLSNPRWAVYRKKGKTHVGVREVIYFDEYNKMNDEELYDRIYKGLYVNPYEDSEKPLFKGKKIAKGLERLLFMDLKKNIPLQTYTVDNKLKSHVSDFELTYLETGYARDKDGIEYSLVDLNQKTIKSYLKYYQENKTIELETEFLNLEQTFKKEKKNLGKGKLILNKDKIILRQEEDIVIDFENTSSIAIQGKRKIIIYYNDQTYLVTFYNHDSPYIYLITYEFYKKGDELNDSTSGIQNIGL